MANPTTPVKSFRTSWNDEVQTWAIPVLAGSASDLFVTGEMIGFSVADGLAHHFDDTAALVFLGLFEGPDLRYSADQPTPILIKVRRPRYYSMQLVSGTTTRILCVGKPCYAGDSGHVQLAATVNSNLAGIITNLAEVAPEVSPGSWVQIAPPVWGGLLGAP